MAILSLNKSSFYRYKSVKKLINIKKTFNPLKRFSELQYPHGSSVEVAGSVAKFENQTRPL